MFVGNVVVVNVDGIVDWFGGLCCWDVFVDDVDEIV